MTVTAAPGLPDYRRLTADDVAGLTDAAIRAADERVARMVDDSRPATFERILRELDDAEGDLHWAHGCGAFMARVHPDVAVRSAGQTAEERINKWRSDLPFRDDVAGAVLAYASSAEAASLAGPERLLLEHRVLEIRRAGHGLEPTARAELQARRGRAIDIESAFQRNLDEWKDGIDLGRDDRAGLPDEFHDRLGPGERPDSLRVTVDAPDAIPFLAVSARRDLRELMQVKFDNRAMPANRALLEELVAVRRRMAALLEYGSWADFRLEVRMAQTPDLVWHLLDETIEPLQRLARSEHAEMTRHLEADAGQAVLERWDWRYYDRVVRRETYDVDSEEVAAYLPLDAVLEGLFALTSEVFGIRIAELPDARAWHKDVRLFAISDAATNEALGHFYTDLFPRDGKFGHAMAWPLRFARRWPDGSGERPISAIVANVPRPAAARPSLLRHDDVIMLFHEFGHILHECLSTAAYARQGIFDVEGDFIEAPSQIMEHWAWSAPVLTRFARHYATGEPMPDDLAGRISASETANLGGEFLRSFCSLAVFDLLIHGREIVPLDDAARRADAVRLLPTVEGTFWPASFGHMAGGYDAGYYGYLWSRVHGDDLWSRFETEGMFDRGVGASYRREILEPSASRRADEMLQSFLHREPSSDAFLRLTGLG